MSICYRFTGSILLLFLLGCEDSGHLKVVPVKGMLMIGGEPAGRANLAFHAVDSRVIECPVAVTGDDGSFRLMTYASDDGAPLGDYIVTIFWRDETIPLDGCIGDDLVKHDRLHGAYFDRRSSPLRATVHARANDLLIEANEVRNGSTD